MSEKKRIIVGISGASGAPIALELLRQLRQNREEAEVHLVMTQGALLTMQAETGQDKEAAAALADYVYEPSDMAAAIASGSFRSAGMIVVPCSMKTLAGICSGYSDNLLLRCADVMLKERRRLVLVPRESPFNTIHLRNMYELSQMGAVILPPVLSYYQNPSSLEDCTLHIVGKIMDQFDLKCEGFCRWNGADKISE